jgi:hypothetical protein
MAREISNPLTHVINFLCHTHSFKILYLSLAHILNDLLHTICWIAISILALTTGNPVYLISPKGERRMWPFSKWCLFLFGTWSYLCICRRSESPYTRFYNCLLDYDCVVHIANFSILYSKHKNVVCMELWSVLKWLSYPYILTPPYRGYDLMIDFFKHTTEDR